MTIQQSESQKIKLKEILPKTVTTAIFDMDDLMINSHPLHMKVFEAILQSYGISLNNPVNPFTREEEISQFGKKISDMCAYLIDKYSINTTPPEMAQEFNDLMIPVFEKENIKPMDGLMSLIHDLTKHGFRFVLASSAKRRKIDIVLGKLGLTQVFPIIVSGEDEIEHGKPAPDIFLKATEKADVNPNECMVFEDAKNGIESAKAAGIFTVGVHNKLAEERLGLRQDLSKSDIQIDGLDNISFE